MRPATCLHQLCHKSTKTNTGSDRNATRHCRPKPWGSGVLSELAFSLLASLSYSAHAFACLPCCDTEFNGLYLSQSISNCRRSCTSAITSVTDATLPQRVVAPSSSPEYSLTLHSRHLTLVHGLAIWKISYLSFISAHLCAAPCFTPWCSRCMCSYLLVIPTPTHRNGGNTIDHSPHQPNRAATSSLQFLPWCYRGMTRAPS